MSASHPTMVTPAGQMDVAMPDQITDDQLLRQMAAGDKSAFEAIYHRYMPRVRTYELLVYHECSYNDIAIRRDIPVGTIKTRVMRGRKRLAVAMAS